MNMRSGCIQKDALGLDGVEIGSYSDFSPPHAGAQERKHMNPQQEHEIDQQLRPQSNWDHVRLQLAVKFRQVSIADIEAANNPRELVQRIGDKTGLSDRYVESQLIELLGVSNGNQFNPQNQQGQQVVQSQPYGGQTNQNDHQNDQQSARSTQERQFAASSTGGSPYGG